AFEQLALNVLAGQGAEPGDVELNSLEQQQREEEPRLMFGHPTQRTARVAGVLGAPSDHTNADVGVVILMIGVRVVSVVFVDPPAVAHPESEIADDQPRDLAGLPGAEHLPMPDVMAEE